MAAFKQEQYSKSQKDKMHADNIPPPPQSASASITLPNNQVVLTLSTSFTKNTLSPVSIGQGTSQIQPSTTGALLVNFKCQVSNSGSGNGAWVGVWRTTGTIPASGVAPPTGDILMFTLGQPMAVGGGASGTYYAALWYDTGLNRLVTYSYYITMYSSTSVANTTISSGGVLQITER